MIMNTGHVCDRALVSVGQSVCKQISCVCVVCLDISVKKVHTYFCMKKCEKCVC